MVVCPKQPRPPWATQTSRRLAVSRGDERSGLNERRNQRGLDSSVSAGLLPGVASDAPSASGVTLHHQSPFAFPALQRSLMRRFRRAFLPSSARQGFGLTRHAARRLAESIPGAQSFQSEASTINPEDRPEQRAILSARQ